MIDAIKYFPFDQCPACKSRTIEGYNNMCRPVNYNFFVNNNRMDEIKYKGIYYFKCKNCNKTFLPEWLDNNTVRPLYNKNKMVCVVKQFIKG